MPIPDEARLPIEILRSRYLGKRIIVLSMESVQNQVEPGTKATVLNINKDGWLHAQCDNGICAKLIPDEDVFALDIDGLRNGN